MKQALSIAILVALASLVGVHAQETEGVLKPRTEIRGAVSSLVKELQRREAEVVKAFAAQEALALQPEDPAIHYNLGVLYDDCLAQKNRAQKHYNRFLELAPDDDDAPRVVEWLSQIQ